MKFRNIFVWFKVWNNRDVCCLLTFIERLKHNTYQDLLIFENWEKTKIANSYVDIWWCPWDKGGAVIYVIGGTHPPIWLAIDINHHQISNGHAFPSAIKCAHSVWHKSKTSFSVCLSAPVGLERQTRGNLLLKRAKEAAAASHQWPWKPQMGGE